MNYPAACFTIPGMVEDAHPFIWSARQAEEFELCRRKRYWSVYGRVPDWRRLLTRSEAVRRVVREASRWMLDEQRAGRPASAADAYEQSVRSRLNQAWAASRSGTWRQHDSRDLALHELHFAALHRDLPDDWPQRLKDDVLRCLRNFESRIYPRLAGVADLLDEAMSRRVLWAEEQALIGVDPDFVCEESGTLRIHVWETDSPSVDHVRRVAVLVWWAHRVTQREPETIEVWLEYLGNDYSVREIGSREVVDQAGALMIESMRDMSDYLEQTDRPRNRPLPKAEWDMTPDRVVCDQCRYYALCEPDFQL